MSLVVPNGGEVIALDYLFNKATPEDVVLRLFKSDTTPAETDTAGSYTEADFSGYGAKTLTGAAFTVTPGAPSTASAPQQTFESDADQTLQNVYGYYVTRAASGDLLFVERFASAPFPVENEGDAIKVTLNVSAD